jgi:type IV pilus assembly protein PilV
MRQHGVSLLEVLIALAVLSIGLAGLAIMHLNAQKYVHSAYERSLVSSIALDLEERLWLRVADTSSVGCPTLTKANGTAIYELVDHWSNASITTESGKKIFPARIPGLSVTVLNSGVTGSAGSGPAYAEVDLRFCWADFPFSDSDCQNANSSDDLYATEDAKKRFLFSESGFQWFDYTARIYCSADYTTGS